MAEDEEFELESCRACRGEGKVVSNLGGESAEVTCPWCDGTGKYIPEHDAQAKWPQTSPEEAKPAPEAEKPAPEEEKPALDA